MLCCLTPAHPFRNSQPHLQIKFHGVDPLSLLRSLQKGNRWPDFTPPAAGLFRRYRGRFLHRRSHALALVLIVFFFKPAILDTTQDLNAAFNPKTAADVTFEPTIWYDANMKGGWDVRIQNPVDSEVSLSGAFVVPSGVEGRPPTAFPLYRLIPDRIPPSTSTTVQALLWERGVDNGVSRTNLTFLFHNRQSIWQQSQLCNLCLDFRDINGGSGHKCYDFQCTRIPLPTAP